MKIGVDMPVLFTHPQAGLRLACSVDSFYEDYAYLKQTPDLTICIYFGR